MSEVEKLLERQARWQRSRKALPWPVKIRMAEQIRDSVLAWRAAASGNPLAARDARATTPARSSRSPRPRPQDDSQ